MSSFSELCTEVIYFQESQKDLDLWLKNHSYDDNTKTVKIGDRRVKVEFPKSDEDYTKFDTKVEYNDRYKKRLNREAKKVDPKLMKRLYEPKTYHNIGNVKIDKIKVANPKHLNYDEIDYAMNQQYGNIQYMSDARSANREPNWFSKYNYNTIPKEYRKEFLELKKKSKENKLTDQDKTRMDMLKDEIKEAIKQTSEYRRDKDQKRKDKYNRDYKAAVDATLKASPTYRYTNPGVTLSDKYAADKTGNSSQKASEINKNIDRKLQRTNKEQEIKQIMKSKDIPNAEKAKKIAILNAGSAALDALTSGIDKRRYDARKEALDHLNGENGNKQEISTSEIKKPANDEKSSKIKNLSDRIAESKERKANERALKKDMKSIDKKEKKRKVS